MRGRTPEKKCIKEETTTIIITTTTIIIIIIIIIIVITTIIMATSNATTDDAVARTVTGATPVPPSTPTARPNTVGRTVANFTTATNAKPKPTAIRMQPPPRTAWAAPRSTRKPGR